MVSSKFNRTQDIEYILDSSAHDGVGAESAVADKLLGGLVVDGGESRQFGKELVEERRGQRVDGGDDRGLIREHNVLCRI